MYPIALETQYSSFFTKTFSVYARELEKRILPRLKEYFSTRSDSANIRHDADLFSFLEQLRSEHGSGDSAAIEKKIRANFHLIDAWSRDRVTESLEELYVRQNAPQGKSVTGREAPAGRIAGEQWLTTVGLSSRSGITKSLIDTAISRNVGLIKTLQQEHLSGLVDTIKNGITGGKTHGAIVEDIQGQTGVNRSRAKFWARDQAGKFFGEVTKSRQTAAGIPGYIWRTLPGARDSHAALEGTYHAWNNPPQILRKAKKGFVTARLHPGQDYNCRCFAEPAFGPEYAERKYNGPALFAEPFGEEYFKERAGTTPTSWRNTGTILDRIAIDIENQALKGAVGETIEAVSKIMTIPLDKMPALSVNQITAENQLYGTRTVGYYGKGHIGLQTGNRYAMTTTVHELFHFLRAKNIPRSKTYTAGIAAIKESDQYKELRSLSKSASPDEKGKLAYLMDESELFSRAMEQFIARYIHDNGGSAAYLEQFVRKSINSNRRYWVDSDYESIYIKLTELFEELRWL